MPPEWGEHLFACSRCSSAGQRAHGIGSLAGIPEPPGITVQVGVAPGEVGLAGGRVALAVGFAGVPLDRGVLVLVGVREAVGVEVRVGVRERVGVGVRERVADEEGGAVCRAVGDALGLVVEVANSVTVRAGMLVDCMGGVGDSAGRGRMPLTILDAWARVARPNGRKYPGSCYTARRALRTRSRRLLLAWQQRSRNQRRDSMAAHRQTWGLWAHKAPAHYPCYHLRRLPTIDVSPRPEIAMVGKIARSAGLPQS